MCFWLSLVPSRGASAGLHCNSTFSCLRNLESPVFLKDAFFSRARGQSWLSSTPVRTRFSWWSTCYTPLSAHLMLVLCRIRIGPRCSTWGPQRLRTPPAIPHGTQCPEVCCGSCLPLSLFLASVASVWLKAANQGNRSTPEDSACLSLRNRICLPRNEGCGSDPILIVFRSY